MRIPPLQLPEAASGGSGPSSGREVVASLLEELLATNPRRGLDARAAIGLKVADRVLLLDNPASTHAAGAPCYPAGASRL